ncbi:MAG: D-alanyl-D-alanine carboxypeptidase, partial [bacterium]
MKNFPTKVAAILCACVVTLPMFRVSIASTIDWGESRFCCSKEPREISLSETDPRIMQLNDQISKLILPRVERSEDWGALVVSLEHGDTLFSYSKDRTLSPASNMKLFTTAAALHFLGSKFRYQTFLYYDGPI